MQYKLEYLALAYKKIPSTEGVRLKTNSNQRTKNHKKLENIIKNMGFYSIFKEKV